MGIELICADENFRELCEITEFTQFDAVASLDAEEGSNDYMLELPVSAWQSMPIRTGYYIYIEGSEWGGPVERVRHSSTDGTVRIYGTTWRGMLSRHIVCPEAGQTHVSIQSQEANAAVSALLSGWRSELFAVSGEYSAVTCSASIRYRPLLEALYTMLDGVGRLCIAFSGGKAALSVQPVRDRTDEVELSQDYEAKIVSDDRARIYNHIIALG
ncbi:MAG: hypothetical protein IJC18_04425, partial [Clostridia bacterium]|nr:hypothetical protein [Clostridia bacterium]